MEIKRCTELKDLTFGNTFFVVKRTGNGEHNEIHKHRHNFVKGHKISGRIAINALEPKSMKARHDALAAEIRR